MAFNWPNNPTVGQQYNPAPGLIYEWSGQAWVGVNSGGLVEEAPVDAFVYGRMAGTWVQVPGEAPIDTRAYVRKDGAWAISDSLLVDAPLDGTLYARRDGLWELIGIADITNLTAVLDLKLEDANADGITYGRRDNIWRPVAEEAPNDAESYVRKDGAWTILTHPPFPEAPVDGLFYGRRDAAWALPVINDISGLQTSLNGKLNLTGGTLTGTLTITASGTPFILNKSAISQSSVIAYMTLNQTRWVVGTNPETGSGNAGADYFIDRYSDLGAPLGRALLVSRATGVFNFTVAPTVAGAPLLADAPSDGKDYIRFNGAWAVMDWANLDGKPTTFTPAAHTHPTSQVTGLDAALAARPTDAPTDGSLYARAGGVWRHPVTTDITDLPAIINDMVEEAPANGVIYGRRDNLWTPVVAAADADALRDRILALEARLAILEAR